jgi:hypothetical protein
MYLQLTDQLRRIKGWFLLSLNYAGGSLPVPGLHR